jgi:Icc-related predicted phosphoesterase
MKLVLISDTHTKHAQLELPEGDILIHAGDYSFNGTESERMSFYRWFNSQPHKHKVFIAGNHDFGESEAPKFNGSTYLYESGVEVEGLKLWGSPWTPEFGEWAFMYDRATGLERWANIPAGTDVLITHGPALGFRDRVAGYRDQVGCYDLRNKVLEVKPKVHVFGHIHGSYGIEVFNGTTFVNASVVNEAYKISNQPIVVEL